MSKGDQVIDKDECVQGQGFRVIRVTLASQHDDNSIVDLSEVQDARVLTVQSSKTLRLVTLTLYPADHAFAANVTERCD